MIEAMQKNSLPYTTTEKAVKNIHQFAYEGRDQVSVL